MEAPFLTVSELRQEVERIFRRDHRSRLVALYGRGEAGEFELGGDRWRVVPTRCELDLRERLPRPADEASDGSVFLIDWVPDVLPLDVACRLAGGRLYHVARDARLAALFGARQLEQGLAGSALAKLFLAGGVAPPRKVQGLQLTHRVAWMSLLEARVRLPETALASPALLLAWAASNDGGPAFARQVENDDLWRNVRRELSEWLRADVGEAADVVWRAWERGLAVRLLEVLPLLEASGAAGDPFVAGQLAGQLAAWLPDLSAAVRGVESVLVQRGSLDAALPADRAGLLVALDRSQALAESAGLGSLTMASRRLPGGHRARERDLGRAAQAFLDDPSHERAAGVVAALGALEAHALDTHVRPEDHRSARRSVARIALWLAHREARAPSGTRWQPAVDLARQYAEEGGYVEWARQQLRGLRAAEETLISAARKLELEAARVQSDDHRTFAEAYVRWLASDKPGVGATPIENVGKQVIAPFLGGDRPRRLLVVLMDGMSHAAAAQLVTRLSIARRWGPIAWRPDGWEGVLPLPPVLAVAPTLTEISRGAFFAGKADPRFGDEGTDKDPARWKAHRAVARLLGEDAPPLFVRRDILSGHDLATDLRDAIEGTCPAVAVVVNAIDEDLKGSVQVAIDYSLAPVLPLEALLTAAEEGERVVLLVADHGHVLGDGTRPLEGRLGKGRPGGARWRALAADEMPEPDEVALPRTCWSPRGWDRVAVLWDPTVVNRATSYGAHGGLSLAEAVAPAILIAPDWLERAAPNDPGLAARPSPTPDWWELRARRATVRPEPTSAAKPASAAKPTPDQTVLFAPAPTESAAPAAPAAPALIVALSRSSVFQNQVAGLPAAEAERVLLWLSILVEAGGSLPAGEFAAAAGVRGHQVGGVVARMGVLNADGFAMVEHDHVGRRVVLQRSRLVQHYGIKE
ncbi:MAG: BREX-2 system phosphatase PglZ [Myxococcales bacterium]|nr:BREX-2 system phosphatase PglZ [Myxococcales bacterium]